MIQKKKIKRYIRKMLIYLGLYPHIFFYSNPFKIYEFKEILRDIKFSRNDLILDVGPGNGLQTLLLGKRCKKIIGIDVSKKAIITAKYTSRYMAGRINSKFLCVDIKNTKFKNEYFDKIFSICVIEHIPNYIDVLQECYKILKKNGEMIFSVDSLETIKDKKLLEKHKKDHLVQKYFKKNEVEMILKEIGFNRIKICPIFKSNFAKKLFIKGINNKFQYGNLKSILAYFYLRYKEKYYNGKKKGLFLVIKCKK